MLEKHLEPALLTAKEMEVRDRQRKRPYTVGPNLPVPTGMRYHYARAAPILERELFDKITQNYIAHTVYVV